MFHKNKELDRVRAWCQELNSMWLTGTTRNPPSSALSTFITRNKSSEAGPLLMKALSILIQWSGVRRTLLEYRVFSKHREA